MIKLTNILKEIFRDPFNGDIYEGLVKTIDIETSVDVLYKRFKDLKGFNINSNKNNIFIGFNPTYVDSNLSNYVGNIQDNNIVEILKLANNLGYFPSNITYTSPEGDYNESKKYSSSNLRKALQEEPKYIEFVFEKKFDNVVTPPRYIYHITNKKWVDKIKQIGLKPKSLNKSSSHSERIYFSLDKEYSNTLWEKLKLFFGPNEGILLVIDTNGLDITFYNDPNFDRKGIYTYQNISPSNIIKIEPITE